MSSSMSLYIQKAIQELSAPTFAITEQILDRYVIKKNDVSPLAPVRIAEGEDDMVLLFEVEEYSWYVAVFVRKETKEVSWIDTVPKVRACLRVTSEQHSFEELKAMLPLHSTSGWSKGDHMSFDATRTYDFSRLYLEPTYTGYTTEQCISDLVAYLERDRKGLEKIIQSTHVYIEVVINFEIGNGLVPGYYVDNDLLARIAALGLGVGFDFYVSGVAL